MSRRGIGRALSVLIWSGIAGPAWVLDAQPAQRDGPARINYMLNCMGCHVVDGSGSPGKVPSVRSSLVLLSQSTAGRRYLVQVPGASRSPLSNLELAQVLSWMVRNLSSRPIPRTFVDFTADEVAGYRKTPLVDVRNTRARLLADRPAGTLLKPGTSDLQAQR